MSIIDLQHEITRILYHNEKFRKAVEELYTDSFDSYVRERVRLYHPKRILATPTLVFKALDALFIRLDDFNLVNSVVHYGSSAEVGKKYNDIDLAVITERSLSDEEEKGTLKLLRPSNSDLRVSLDEYGSGVESPWLTHYGLHLWLLSKNKVFQMIREYFSGDTSVQYRDLANGILKGNIIYHRDNFIFDTNRLMKKLRGLTEEMIEKLEQKYKL